MASTAGYGSCLLTIRCS